MVVENDDDDMIWFHFCQCNELLCVSWVFDFLSPLLPLFISPSLSFFLYISMLLRVVVAAVVTRAAVVVVRVSIAPVAKGSGFVVDAAFLRLFLIHVLVVDHVVGPADSVRRLRGSGGLVCLVCLGTVRRGGSGTVVRGMGWHVPSYRDRGLCVWCLGGDHHVGLRRLPL
jgi:hypothetical protein